MNLGSRPQFPGKSIKQDQMNKFIFIAAVLAASPVVAQTAFEKAPWVNAESPKGYIDTTSTVALQIKAAQAHDKALESQIIEGGGCQADVLPYWVAAFCSQKAFGAGHVNNTPGSEN